MIDADLLGKGRIVRPGGPGPGWRRRATTGAPSIPCQLPQGTRKCGWCQSRWKVMPTLSASVVWLRSCIAALPPQRGSYVNIDRMRFSGPHGLGPPFLGLSTLPDGQKEAPQKRGLAVRESWLQSPPDQAPPPATSSRQVTGGCNLASAGHTRTMVWRRFRRHILGSVRCSERDYSRTGLVTPRRGWHRLREDGPVYARPGRRPRRGSTHARGPVQRGHQPVEQRRQLRHVLEH